MITKTEKLLDTKNMTIKETNELARRLDKHYGKIQKSCEKKFKLTTLHDNAHYYYGYKISALITLRSALITLGYCNRRSEKMLLDLESAIAYAETKKVVLL